MPLYRLRYFFDPGSGICLWSANDAARERYDYPVEITELGLPENLWRRIVYVMAWYDTFLDWSDPGGGAAPWGTEEFSRFNQEAQTMLRLLREHLGPEYEIIDESHTDGPIDA